MAAPEISDQWHRQKNAGCRAQPIWVSGLTLLTRWPSLNADGRERASTSHNESLDPPRTLDRRSGIGDEVCSGSDGDSLLDLGRPDIAKRARGD